MFYSATSLGRVNNMPERGLPGRASEAARNDSVILDAARLVLSTDPRASMSAIGRAAGVGMSALYRRYENKATLLQVLLAETRAAYEEQIALAQDRLDEGLEPFEVYVQFLTALVAAHANFLAPTASGMADAGAADRAAWGEVSMANLALFERVRAAGALRDGLTFLDIAVLITAVSSIRGEDVDRSRTLRSRVLAVVVEGLRSVAPRLSGDGPTVQDFSGQ